MDIGMDAGRAFMNVVGGNSAPALGRGDISVIDPSDGEEFTTIARGRSEDIDTGVLAAFAFNDEDDAIESANGTNYGLTAGV